MTVDIPTTQEIPVVLVLSARSQEQRKIYFLLYHSLGLKQEITSKGLLLMKYDSDLR